MVLRLGSAEHPENYWPAFGLDFTVRSSRPLPTFFRALLIRGQIVTALEVLHVLAMGGEGRCAAAGLQGLQRDVDFSLAEYHLLEGLDVLEKADTLGYVGRHFSIEGAATYKGDDRL